MQNPCQVGMSGFLVAEASFTDLVADTLESLDCLFDSGESCPTALVEVLADCFREVFELKREQVTLNEPFAGGFITRTYGNDLIPCIQLEINRSFYLSPPWFDGEETMKARCS